MRIIAGRFRGRRLTSVRTSIHPTTDRMREALFSVLGDRVSGTTWLDLFAGTGAVGLEALSRGAARAIFNDRDPRAVAILRRNLERLGVSEGNTATVLSRDAFVLLRNPPDPPVDFVFLDPPYGFPRYRKLLRKAADSSATGPGTVVILEVSRRTPVDFLPAGWELLREVGAGDSRHLLLRPVIATD
jgi:16S rRNA (guanine966-N2)-methyltransferase